MLTKLTRTNHDPAASAKVRALMEQSARAEQVLAKNNATLRNLSMTFGHKFDLI